jgi:uncharacterized protein (TIGR00251 family)
METYVKIKPGQTEFKVDKGSFYEIGLTQPAENGQANAELVRRLGEILGMKPGIISGHQSRRKKIKVDITEEEFERRMEAII